MTSYTTTDEYELRPFDSAWYEVSTILDFLSYIFFGGARSINFQN